jgi:dihydroorotate dehydrogenase (fumarate)
VYVGALSLAMAIIEEPSIATAVGGIKLESCIYNASGPRTGTSAAMSKIASSRSGAVLSKSSTPNPQTGNPQPRTWHDLSNEHIASLNSEGLPNAGIEYYVSKKTISESIGNTQKPYFVSISGYSLADNLKMIDVVRAAIVDKGAEIAALELNLACPNVIGKPIIAYDFSQMEHVLDRVCSVPFIARNEIILGVKLPPYFDTPVSA